MEDKKELKKKRVPAPKTNTCIKWHHLGRTATALTLEELGLLYFMLQVVDDTKEVRYELIADDFTKELLIEKEQEYIKLFEKKMRENPVFRILFEAHAGQIKSSREYYERLVQRVEENNDLVDKMQGTATQTTTETPTSIITKTSTETTTETTTETAETEENENDYEFDEENVYFYNDSLHQIETVGFTQEQVAIFLYKNKERFDLPIKDISIVLNEMMSC